MGTVSAFTPYEILLCKQKPCIQKFSKKTYKSKMCHREITYSIILWITLWEEIYFVTPSLRFFLHLSWRWCEMKNRKLIIFSSLRSMPINRKDVYMMISYFFLFDDRLNQQDTVHIIFNNCEYVCISCVVLCLNDVYQKCEVVNVFLIHFQHNISKCGCHLILDT